jgi:hypothetical protein
LGLKLDRLERSEAREGTRATQGSGRDELK